jgi:uncharacterized protein (TIGR02246 family)
MKYALLLLLPLLVSCGPPRGTETDSLVLAEMIAERERAMIEKDVEAALSQFSDDATWINSQGYYFEGKDSVREFHGMLAGNTVLDYAYEAGAPKIRLVDAHNAIAYYSWKMTWFTRGDPADIVKEEIGLMTLTARKREGRWQWIAVTNQHTPWFYEALEPATIDHE